ncbi:hypothetical protein QQF64_001967 [Cirrhinus molitorella]|uniref:Uncharacterized protein n=1 Tax=Cirrhinus molitorella TaxID=172907 RepID=A0ABR3MNU1_9TELE
MNLNNTERTGRKRRPSGLGEHGESDVMLKQKRGDVQLQATFGRIKPEMRAAPSAPPILSHSQQERQKNRTAQHRRSH